MSHRVEVSPSGHRFVAEDRESLLHAALRAGLNIPHACASGACGLCRARLLSGRLQPLRVGDFRLSEAERREGWFLSCCQRPASDLEIQVHEVGEAQEIPLQQLSCRFTGLEPLSERMVQVNLRTPRARGLSFLAGQRVDLRLADLPPRRLAVASCPCDSQHLRFNLCADEEDPLFLRLRDAGRRGMPVDISGPYGEFVLRESPRGLALLVWEQGFAAAQSLIEQALSADENRPVRLYWAAGDGGHYLANYCRALADSLDDFAFGLPVLEREQDWEPLVAELLGSTQARDWDWYLSLPSAGAVCFTTLASRSGLSPGQWFVDQDAASVPCA